MNRLLLRMIPGLCLLTIALPASAGELRWSAYVTQAYLRSDSDEMTLTQYDERGTFGTTLYALKLDMQASDDLSLHTEIQGDQNQNPFAESGGTSLEPVLVVAEGRWRLSDALALRAGIIKQPFGFYNEYRNVGIAYEPTLLMTLYQNIIGFMVENYRGIALQGQIEAGPGILNLDAYFGETQMVCNYTPEGWLIIPAGENLGNLNTYRLRNLVGGRLVAADFLPGLEVGFSGFVGWQYSEEDNSELQWSSWMLSARWRWEFLLAQGEWARNNNDNGSEGWYVLGGVVLWDQLTAFVQIDRFYGDRNHRSAGVWGDFSQGQLGSYNHNTQVGVKWDALPLLTLKAGWGENRSNMTSIARMIGPFSASRNYDHIYTLSATVSYF